MAEDNDLGSESEETTNSEEKEQPSTFSIKEIEELQETARDFKDKYYRALAESENARKRMQKERQDITKYALENVIVEFLHPLDNFEKALKFAQNMSDELKNWAIGFEMILAQFKQVLTNHNVVEYSSMGKKFDPHLHEALEIVETDDCEPGHILHEFAPGYKMGDRVIRVAKVKVAKAPESAQGELKNEELN